MTSKKDHYADGIADYLLQHGLASASLRPIAKSVGTSDRMLIYHFGSKTGVIEAGLMAASARLFEQLSEDWDTINNPADAISSIFDALTTSEMQGYMALWQDIVAGAMRGDMVCKRAGFAMVESYIPWLSDRLGDATLSALTLVVIDGAAQLQAVGRDDDLRAALTAYLKLLSNKR